MDSCFSELCLKTVRGRERDSVPKHPGPGHCWALWVHALLCRLFCSLAVAPHFLYHKVLLETHGIFTVAFRQARLASQKETTPPIGFSGVDGHKGKATGFYNDRQQCMWHQVTVSEPPLLPKNLKTKSKRPAFAVKPPCDYRTSGQDFSADHLVQLLRSCQRCGEIRTDILSSFFWQSRVF